MPRFESNKSLLFFNNVNNASILLITKIYFLLIINKSLCQRDIASSFQTVQSFKQIIIRVKLC